MAKCKRSSRRPQPKHKKNSRSQHDKRKRLERRNPKRKKTTHARVPLAGTIRTAVSLLQAAMDRRIAFRLAIVVAGMFLADDRRTASVWFVAAGVQDDWDRFYDCLIGVGRDRAAAPLDAVRPPGRRAETRGEIWLGIPHQTSARRGAVGLVHAVDLRAGRSKNTSTTSRKSGARDSNRSATCGRTLAAGT